MRSILGGETELLYMSIWFDEEEDEVEADAADESRSFSSTRSMTR